MCVYFWRRRVRQRAITCFHHESYILPFAEIKKSSSCIHKQRISTRSISTQKNWFFPLGGYVFSVFLFDFVFSVCRSLIVDVATRRSGSFLFPAVCKAKQNKKSDFSLCHSIFYRLRVFVFIDFASGTFARCFYLYFFFANVINPSADVNLRQPQPLFEEEKKIHKQKAAIRSKGAWNSVK